MERPPSNLTCAPKGLILDESGRVAGFWVRGRKRRVHTHLFAQPIERNPEVTEQVKDIWLDGRLIRNVRVQVCPTVSCFLHWGK